MSPKCIGLDISTRVTHIHLDEDTSKSQKNEMIGTRENITTVCHHISLVTLVNVIITLIILIIYFLLNNFQTFVNFWHAKPVIDNGKKIGYDVITDFWVIAHPIS
jgi:uncharacterized membrane protein (DUF485 family)